MLYTLVPFTLPGGDHPAAGVTGVFEVGHNVPPLLTSLGILTRLERPQNVPWPLEFVAGGRDPLAPGALTRLLSMPIARAHAWRLGTGASTAASTRAF